MRGELKEWVARFKIDTVDGRQEPLGSRRYVVQGGEAQFAAVIRGTTAEGEVCIPLLEGADEDQSETGRVHRVHHRFDSPAEIRLDLQGVAWEGASTRGLGISLSRISTAQDGVTVAKGTAMGEHVVKQGEYMSKIARQYGFADYRTIWDHSKNTTLKVQRQNPNVLLPGDRLHIPDKQSKDAPGATQQRHTFIVATHKLKLRLVLCGVDNHPIANIPCELRVEGDVHNLVTDANGLVEHEIPKAAEMGMFVVTMPERALDIEVPLQIGHLDPVDAPSGQVARLNNLGYNAGAIGGDEQGQFRSAVEEFQCDHGLTVDGICGRATQAKLRDVHGC